MRFIPMLLLALACGPAEPVDTGSVCPAPTDACMSEDNHQECLDAEAECPGGVMFLESCPLQFACS